MNQAAKHYRSLSDWYRRKVVSRQAIEFERILLRNSFILEVGCGSGVDSRYFAERGHRVVVSDIVNGTASILCKAENLPFRSDVFDAIFCRGVLHLCYVGKAIEEFRRVLEPGGKLFVSYLLNERHNGTVVSYSQEVNLADWANIIWKRYSIRRFSNHAHDMLELCAGRL